MIRQNEQESGHEVSLDIFLIEATGSNSKIALSPAYCISRSFTHMSPRSYLFTLRKLIEDLF